MSGTSLVVAAGTGAVFPAVPFNVVVWPAGQQPVATNAEIVRVTARATDTLTITRTQEGTSARSIIIGDQIAASITKKILDDLAALDTPPSARAFHNATQSLTTGVLTALAFNSERYDTDVIHDTVTNNTRLTCKTAGKYRITINAEFAASSTGRRIIDLLVNGTTVIGRVAATALASGEAMPMGLSCDWSLAVNDYVEARALQDTMVKVA